MINMIIAVITILFIPNERPKYADKFINLKIPKITDVIETELIIIKAL